MYFIDFNDEKLEESLFLLSEYIFSVEKDVFLKPIIKRILYGNP